MTVQIKQVTGAYYLNKEETTYSFFPGPEDVQVRREVHPHTADNGCWVRRQVQTYRLPLAEARQLYRRLLLSGYEKW